MEKQKFPKVLNSKTNGYFDGFCCRSNLKFKMNKRVYSIG